MEGWRGIGDSMADNVYCIQNKDNKTIILCIGWFHIMTMNPCCLDSMPSACNTSALIIIIVTCVAIASWSHDFMETQEIS